MFQSIIVWFTANSATLAIIFAALYGLCEALAAIPSIKANSAFQALMNGIKWIKENIFKSPAA